MALKRFFTASHLLHSRLQLIRNKMQVRKDMTPQDLVEWNKNKFDRAAESVTLQHEIHVGRTEMHQAAELFIMAFKADDLDITSQPMWKPRK